MNAESAIRESKFIDVLPRKSEALRNLLLPVWHSALSRVLTWIERANQRDALRELDPQTLNDIGVTPEQARRESLKVFWMD